LLVISTEKYPYVFWLVFTPWWITYHLLKCLFM